MAKDPAFLFFPGDWLGGTMTFSRSHKGAYMDLLMVQFNEGHMSLQDIQTILGDTDFSEMWEKKLKRKFKQDPDGNFYNEKLENEVNKRRKFTESRAKNLSHKKEDKVTHMESLMENGNGNIDNNIKEVGSEKVQQVANEVWKDKIWLEQSCMAMSLDLDQLKKWMAAFNASISNDTIADFNKSKYKKMIGGWIRKQQSKGVTIDSGVSKTATAPPLKRLNE